MNRTALTILCGLIVFVPCLGYAADEETASPDIHVLADSTEYEFETESFTASGNARVTYGDVLLTADSVTGNVGAGNVDAVGNVTFRQADRAITGDSFSYNFITGTGLAQNAAASVEGIYFRGEQLKSEPGQYTITRSRFTTCDRPKPHYYLSAKELIVRPGQKLTARHVAIYFFGNRIINVPSYSVKLGEGKKKHFNLPQIGISRQYGLHAGYEFNLSHGESTSGNLRVIMSTRQVFQGGFEYRRIAGRPIIANLTYRQPYYGGLNTNSLVSRLPEIGYGFISPDVEQQTEDTDEPDRMLRQLLSPDSRSDDRGGISYSGQVSVGHLIEEPGHIKSGRLDIRGVAWLKPHPIDGGTLVSPGISLRHSMYDSGESYTDLGLRLAMVKSIGRDSYASVTYANHAIEGSTPFRFDAVEIPNELAAKVRVSLGSFNLEVGGRYDLKKSDLFDSEVSMGKVMHCIEPRITWRNRFKEISFDVGLVGF